MSEISGANNTATSSSSASTSTTGSTSTRKAPKKTLDKDDFLQLFITQLVHQNPMEPLDNDQFIAQMAQFTSIEQQTNTASTVVKMLEAQQETNELLSMLLYNQVGSVNKLMYDSANLIGRTVIAQSGEDTPVQGKVARVSLNKGEVEIQLENGKVFLVSEVIEISE